MKIIPILRRLHRRVDALLEYLVSERLRLWMKGVCVAIAKKIWPASLGKADGMPDILPAWAYETVRIAGMHEPELSPRLLIPYLQRLHTPIGVSQVGAIYASLWKRIDHEAKHVFVLGDTDGQVSKLLLQAIEELVADRVRHVMIIWTGSAPAKLGGTLSGAGVLDLNQATGIYQVMPQAITLGRALIEIKPATIHIASSEVAWTMFRFVAAALSEYSALYAELPDIAMSGVNAGRSTAELSVASDISKSIRLVTHSKTIIDKWADRYGIAPVMTYFF